MLELVPEFIRFGPGCISMDVVRCALDDLYPDLPDEDRLRILKYFERGMKEDPQ